MLTQAEFLIRFPEFTPAAPSGLVQSKLDEALGALNPSVYGHQLDTAHGYLAAHLLAINPLGKNARLEDDPANGDTPYGRRYKQIRKELAPRGFVT
tara:strand:- start:99 stop:386 length:288 start_codon:yes stop_codon:yes gene_type:complete